MVFFRFSLTGLPIRSYSNSEGGGARKHREIKGAILKRLNLQSNQAAALGGRVSYLVRSLQNRKGDPTMMRQRPTGRRGFTLIELLVVIAIIGVLIAMLL